MVKPLRRWTKRARLMAANALVKIATKPVPEYSGRRVKIRSASSRVIGHYKRLMRAASEKEELAHFGEMVVHRKGKGKAARYEGLVSKNPHFFISHEAGHIHQMALSEVRPFKLRISSSLATFEDSVLRALGYSGGHYDNPFTLQARKDRKPISVLLKHGAQNEARNLALYFESPKAFLRAILRMYRDPKMEPSLRRMNEKPSAAGMSASVTEYLVDYLKKHPQREIAR